MESLIIAAFYVIFLGLIGLAVVALADRRRTRRREIRTEIEQDQKQVAEKYQLSSELTWEPQPLNLSEEDWDKLINEE